MTQRSPASARMVRVVDASTDARGDVWLSVLYDDGTVQDHELAAVPAALKLAYVTALGIRERGAGLGDPGGERGFFEDLRLRGGEWLAARLRELAELGSRYHEIVRRAGHANRPDLAAQASARADDVRRVRDALTEVAYSVFPEYFEGRGPVGALGNPVLIGVGIVSVAALLAFIANLYAESRDWKAALDAVPANERGGVVRDRYARDDEDGFFDKLAGAAKTLAIVGVSAAAGAVVIPWAVALIRERRAAA